MQFVPQLLLWIFRESSFVFVYLGSRLHDTSISKERLATSDIMAQETMTRKTLKHFVNNLNCLSNFWHMYAGCDNL